MNAEDWLRDKLVEAESLFPEMGFVFATAQNNGIETAFMMASNIPHDELVHLLREYTENPVSRLQRNQSPTKPRRAATTSSCRMP